MDLEEVWRIREEDLYPSLFGPVHRGVFPLSQQIFAPFGEVNIDPTWLHHGVHEFASTAERDSWLFVTSGLSNPWDQEPAEYQLDGVSGAGIEYVLETSSQGDWAILTLLRMLALDLLLASGQIGNIPLGINDRIPLRAPIDGDESATIRNLMLVDHLGEAQLPSGKFRFLSFAGLTDAEAEAARCDSAGLLQKLKQQTDFPIIHPSRPSIV